MTATTPHGGRRQHAIEMRLDAPHLLSARKTCEGVSS